MIIPIRAKWWPFVGTFIVGTVAYEIFPKE